jgi:Tol biopolymer transport system component
LGQLRGGENNYCWSPDGSQVLTGSTKPKFKISWVNKVTGEERGIPSPTFEHLEHVESSRKTGRLLLLTTTPNKNQMWMMNPDGTEQRKLIEGEKEFQSPRWSSNGDSIYYLRESTETSDLMKLSVSSRSTESSVLLRGVEFGDSFSLSADGSQLAYTRMKRYSNLWSSDLPPRGTGPKVPQTQLTFGTSSHYFPSISPDGRWVAFMIAAGHKINIYKMAVDGGPAIQLTFLDSSIVTTPAWSPDGQEIAFICDKGGVPKVWIVNADGGTPVPLDKTNASNTLYRISWAPYPQIVYQQPGLRNFRRVSLETQVEEPLLPKDVEGSILFRPNFSPDKKSMTVYWGQPDNAGIWVFSLEDYSKKLIYAGRYTPFGWSPDGKYIYAQGFAQREVLEIEVGDSKTFRKVMVSPRFAYGLAITPDGRKIILNQAEEQSDVWIMDNFDPSAIQAEQPPK